MVKMDTRKITFVTMMAALGNVLFLISFHLGPIAPGVAFDFSLTTTFIAAFYGGPILGLVTGLFVGLFPGIYFGPLGTGAWLGLVGLPIGKALTGLTAGLLAKKLDLGVKGRSSLLAAPVVLLAYVPECLFTVAYFTYLMPYFIGGGGFGMLFFILPKAWVEIIIIGVLMAALVGNYGFISFINRFFAAAKNPQD